MQIKKLLILISLAAPLTCLATNNTTQKASAKKSNTKSFSVDFVGKNKTTTKKSKTNPKGISVDFVGKKANPSKTKSQSKSKSTNKN